MIFNAFKLNNRKQFASINGVISNLVDVKCRVPQGSVLGPLLFLIDISNLQLAIKHSEKHYFADYTNLLNFNSCVKYTIRQINYDLNNLSNF